MSTRRSFLRGIVAAALAPVVAKVVDAATPDQVLIGPVSWGKTEASIMPDWNTINPTVMWDDVDPYASAELLHGRVLANAIARQVDRDMMQLYRDTHAV